MESIIGVLSMPLSHPSPQTALVKDDHYLGLPLSPQPGTFHQERLESALNTIFSALEDHQKVLLVALQLRIVQAPPLISDQFMDGLMVRFLRHLKGMMLAAQQKLSATQQFRQKACIDYIWMHYTDTDHIPAYAAVLLINKDGYVGHGQRGNDKDTLVFRIQRAWLSALQAPTYLADKAVRIRPVSFQIIGNAPEDIAKAFQIASYCCQGSDKDYGIGSIPFGCSRPSKSAAYR